MRCLSCNEAMKPYDRSRKTLSGMYVDLCYQCYRTISKELPTIGNPNLVDEDDEEASLFDDSILDKGDNFGYTSNIDEED